MASSLHFPEHHKVLATGANLSIKLERIHKVENIKVYNISNNCSLEWCEPMGQGAGFKSLAAGTQALVTSNGVSTDHCEVILGALADINDAAGEELIVQVWGQ